LGEYVLGIDGGTESLRAGIFDLKGNIMGLGFSAYKTYYEHPGWAEQKVEEWRSALIDCIKKSIENSNVNPADIIGIGYDATSCTPVFFEENMEPSRNPILWMDMRSSEESQFIESIDDPARRYNGYGKVSAEWFPCKVLWVKKNQPEVYRKSKIIAEYTDWLTYELTGKWTLGINTVTLRGYYDNRNGGFPKEFYNKIGLGDIFEKLPDKVLKLGEVAGLLRKEIAQKTGLSEGIPVAQGGSDAGNAVIGLNALKPKQLAYITGSSNLLWGTSNKEFHANGLFGTYPDSIIDNTFLIEGGQTSTGSVLKWFKENLVNRTIEDEAAKRNMGVYDYMDTCAEKIPPGSEGVIVLEHWQGNRTPFVDPFSRGVIRGLSLKHTSFHIYRAIMEGVAYGTEAIMRLINKNSFEISEVVACGGTTKSKLWLQIYADVTGLSIKTTTTTEAAALGSAILGAVAAKKYDSITQAADEMVCFKETITPDLAAHERYSFFVDQYIDTYLSLKDSMHDTYKNILSL